MPGSNPRALEKAATIDADVVILDLEDAVAPESKEAARKAVCEAVEAQKFGHREVVVRINGTDSKWGRADLEQVLAVEPNAVLVPKISTRDDVLTVSSLMAGSDVDLWVMVETPMAALNIAEIAALSSGTNLSALVLGTNDLAKDMRASLESGRAAFLTAIQMTVLAARANGLLAIDGVFNDISDEVGLEKECRQGKIFGFDGKTLIHPTQLEICNRVFIPTDAEIDQARQIVEAFDDPVNAGVGVIKVAGKMTELLHLAEAKRLLAMAEAINSAELR
jgi:citrate lyase subunit beta/citryl-CoA lyase